MSETLHLTVAQAAVRVLGVQYSESDGVEQKLFAGCVGIFVYDKHKVTQKLFL